MRRPEGKYFSTEKFWDVGDEDLANVEWINIVHDSRKPEKWQHVLLREGMRRVRRVTYLGGNHWEKYNGVFVYLTDDLFWCEIPEAVKEKGLVDWE